MFSTGLEVYYKDIHGYVDFVCEKYITICMNKGITRDKDVCMLVYPSQYKNIKLTKESEK
jgi:hypothetical protein